LSSEKSVNEQRRMLVVSTGAVGAAGALAAVSTLFVSMAPSERAKAAGAPVEVDLAKLEPGMLITEEWRGKPVWILHRTNEMLGKLGETAALVSDPDSKLPMQPKYATNIERSISQSIWFWWVFVPIWAALQPKSWRLERPLDSALIGAEDFSVPVMVLSSILLAEYIRAYRPRRISKYHHTNFCLIPDC